MAELLIDITRLLDRGLRGRLPTGVDRVSLEYVRHFRDQAQGLVRYRGRWIALGTLASCRLFDGLLDPGPEFSREVHWCVGKRLWLGSKRDLAGKVLLNTSHSGLENSDYSERVRRHGMRPLFFLHDLIPITHPEYCRPGEADKHQRRVATMLDVGRGVIVNSLGTLRALEMHTAWQGVSVPPCVVAPLAPGRLPEPQHQPPLDVPYFVMLGTIEPRKNHFLILHLWRELAGELGLAAPRLVIIGQRGWECEQVVDLLERCDALRGLVIEKPHCDDAELATWLYHARALLFPSFAEGFGMPLIEALMLGLPVIASDLPVFQEIAGDIPEYLNPLDGLGWKQAILDYARPDSARYQAQRERMLGYRPPTWNGHIAAVGGMIAALAGTV